MAAHLSSLEALEARIAPAAVFVDATSLKVTFAGGILKVAPLDSMVSAQISIHQLDNGDFLIGDAEGDDDLEDTADFTGTIKGISVTTGAGDDEIDFGFFAQAGFRGNVTVNSGAGLDRITFSEGLLTGALSATATGELEFLLGGSDAPVYVKNALTAKASHGVLELGNSVRVGSLNASGFDDFGIFGTVAGATTLTSKTSMSIQLGATDGASKATLGTVKITGGAESDYVDFGQVFVLGGVTATLGAGDNSLTAATGTFISGAFSITTLGGDDTVALGEVAGAGPSILGKVTAKLGDALTTNSFTFDSGLLGAGLAFTGGKTGDSVDFGVNARAFGAVTLSMGAGANSANLQSLSDLSALTYTGGADVDNVVIGSVGSGFVKGKISLSGGNDALTLSTGADNLFLSLTADGGKDMNTVTFLGGEDLSPTLVLKNLTAATV